MIKWAGYGKLLKQSFFTLLISCFILLGGSFVNGYQLLTVGDYPVPSNLGNSYNISVLKRGRFLSQYLGYGKRVLALSNKNFIFWSSDGLYLYDYTNDPLQGYFQYYYACDEINLSSGGNYLQNCSNPIKFDLGDIVVSYFVNQLDNGDYLLINRSTESVSCGAYCSYGRLRFDICYSSKSVGSTMCFVGGDNFMGGSALGGDRVFPYRLTNSLSLRSDLSFGNIPDSVIMDPPLYNESLIDGSSQEVSQSNLSGDVMITSCTNEKAFQWYRANGYKTRMCYSSYSNNNDIFTSVGSVSAFDLTGLSIEDVWLDTAHYYRYGQTGSNMDYSIWFKYWRKSYDVYKKNPDIQNPFVGVPVSIFTLMGNVDAYGLPYSDDSVLEFCDLSLYRDRNSIYTGIASSVVCSMSSTEYVDVVVSNQLNPDGGYPGYMGSPISGTTTPIGSSWDGITNRVGYHNIPGSSGNNLSGDTLNTYQDGVSFQNNYFNLLKSNFRYPKGTGDGFIPSYIIIFMCALIFFRFISH